LTTFDISISPVVSKVFEHINYFYSINVASFCNKWQVVLRKRLHVDMHWCMRLIITNI